ncbi:hypothetical protein ACET3X_004569 [Alternaria dauci]|uniref:Uncharacterized protein n=1 Tax=Alternaria dauci TaxID=48095 RepID=A0ABR3UNE4_9PLEO
MRLMLFLEHLAMLEPAKSCHDDLLPAMNDKPAYRRSPIYRLHPQTSDLHRAHSLKDELRPAFWEYPRQAD